MRLLQLGPNNELILTKDLVHDIPPYAILSHTWGNDDDEVKLQDIEENKGKEKPGYQKILFCCQQAKLDGLEYSWVDTCCIDKTNAVELTEAINSMFRWYQNAQKCYVYLADVLHMSPASHSKIDTQEPARPIWKLAFRNSKWLTRGWTLQELIAPVVVEFYSADKQRLGDKRSLEQTLHEVTRIPTRALHGDSLSDFDFDTRISWSLKRVTSKEEDRAYSLLGLLGISMPLIYGEGEEAAFRRLRRELATQTSLAQDPQLEASIDQCLAHLRVSDPRDDRSRIESMKGGLLKDSYRWILEHKDFHQWRGNTDSHLLWIKGDPGKGKTMLLCGITEELSIDSDDRCLVSYFFCQATDTSLNNATAVLRGLLYMLVRQDRSFAKHLYEEWKIAGQRLFEDSNAWDALTRIFTSSTQYEPPGKLVFVIDALDECVKDRARLIDFVTRQSRKSKVKWLVSSRNWPEFEKRLETADGSMRLSLELNTQSISAAVECYIRHQVDELQRNKNIDKLKHNEIIDYLISNADDTFLWVALVCERLRDPAVRARHVMQELRCYPSGLNSLYDSMMQYIDKSRDFKLCREILSIIAVTYRPLRLVELAVLVESESLDLEELKEVVTSCGSFLTLRENVVYFVHQSAKEFLTGSTTSTIFPSGIGQKHASISMSSMRALSQGLRRDIYNLRKPGVSIGQFQSPSPDPLASLRYSCIFWIDHIIEGYPPAQVQNQAQKEIDESGLVYKLLQDKFLNWLEALSLIGSVPSGIASMTKLLQLVQENDKTKQFRGLIYDAFRILQYFGAVITQYPLQAYITTLVFSPTESIIRKLFQQEGPRWIIMRPQVEEQWSANIRTLEGHTGSIYSVAFSKDSKTMASASSDRTVRLWDAGTGEMKRTLEGHTSSVCSVAFSGDGKTVASGSHDRAVRLWDAATGEMQLTLEGHTDSVHSVAFSGNGETVASASSDRTVRLWDVGTGKLQHMLKGHTGTVYSVAFSSDGKALASGSFDRTVRLWDAGTGKMQVMLEGHTGTVRSVTFSSDDKTVASGSHDRTIRLWDARTGEMQLMFEGHTASVFSVAFSGDGKTMASGSDDRSIRLWEASTGEMQLTLEGHTSSVCSVAFSGDGKTVASGSHDSRFRLWDVGTGKMQVMLKGHTGSVHSVVFSNDYKIVASGSHDGTVRLWDARTGEMQLTLKGHTSSVFSVAFSGDGKTVASGSRDETLRLWNVSTGELQVTLKGHTDLVRCVAFSDDGKTVASGSHDGTVRLWDADTGKLQHILESHADWVVSVAFSGDGKTLASASSDRTVRLWDAATGELQLTLEGHTDSVRSVTFSGDGKTVASASRDATVRLWNVGTGELLQALEIDAPSWTLSLDVNSMQLSTDVGAFSIQRPCDSGTTVDTAGCVPFPTPCGVCVGYGISQDCNWIEFMGDKILWLPVDYRPTTSSVSGPNIVIGCASGRVLIMQFDNDVGSQW